MKMHWLHVLADVKSPQNHLILLYSREVFFHFFSKKKQKRVSPFHPLVGQIALGGGFKFSSIWKKSRSKSLSLPVLLLLFGHPCFGWGFRPKDFERPEKGKGNSRKKQFLDLRE